MENKGEGGLFGVLKGLKSKIFGGGSSSQQASQAPIESVDPLTSRLDAATTRETEEQIAQRKAEAASQLETPTTPTIPTTEANIHPLDQQKIVHEQTVANDPTQALRNLQQQQSGTGPIKS